MMESIVEERLVSFKELEQKIIAYVCELGREITRIILEDYEGRKGNHHKRMKPHNNQGSSPPTSCR